MFIIAGTVSYCLFQYTILFCTLLVYRQTIVAKKRPRDYNPAMHVINVSPTLSKYKTKKHRYRNKEMITY